MLCARESIGDEPFAVLLPDELFGGPTLLDALVERHEKFDAPVIAVMEMPDDEIRITASSTHEPVETDLVRMKEFVEKPRPGTAPSNLGSVGRYVLTPDVLDALEAGRAR